MNNEQKAILNFAYFIFNYPPHWEKKCFKGNGYIIKKYADYMFNTSSSIIGIMDFFMALDRANQVKMINWIQENYLESKEFKIK